MDCRVDTRVPLITDCSTRIARWSGKLLEENLFNVITI